MQTINELNTRIMNITRCINETYPELSKYFEETRSENQDSKYKEVTKKDLQEYLELLKKVFSTYKLSHLNSL